MNNLSSLLKLVFKFFAFKIQEIIIQYLKTSKHGPYFTQTIAGRKVWISSRRDFISEDHVRMLCEKYYFKAYRPSGADVVVDFGASYGHEIAVTCEQLGSNGRYIAVEPQPRVYDCLARTMLGMGPNYEAVITPISQDSTDFAIPPSIEQSIQSVGTAVSQHEVGIMIPSINFSTFLDKYKIEEIDYCKINIEGEERQLIQDLNLKKIKRLLISAHDFRAEKGDGERYRTREFVRGYLAERGFKVSSLYPSGKGYDFLYAERI